MESARNTRELELCAVGSEAGMAYSSGFAVADGRLRDVDRHTGLTSVDSDAAALSSLPPTTCHAHGVSAAARRHGCAAQLGGSWAMPRGDGVREESHRKSVGDVEPFDCLLYTSPSPRDS